MRNFLFFVLGLVLFLNIPANATIHLNVQTSPIELDTMAKFSEQLFKKQLQCHPNENVMLSPIGIYMTLSLLGNGTSGHTHESILQTLGCGHRLKLGEGVQGHLNYTNKNIIENVLNDSSMVVSNSIWTDGLPIEKNFKKIVEEYYLTTPQSVPFDESGLRTINQWVNEHSHGLIPKILEEFSPNSEMIILNSSAFNGKWEKPGCFWELHQFSNKCEVPFVKLNGYYFETKNAKCFTKHYENGYQFVALLPNGNPYEFMEDMDLIKLIQVLYEVNEIKQECRIYIPRFKFNNTIDLKEIFYELPIWHPTNEFVLFEQAGGLCVSEFKQTNSIDFTEEGTKASSTTMVEIVSYGLDPYIIFDRPFLFFIVKEDIILYSGLLCDPTK